MSVFENVSIVKQANVYFNGKVTSRTVNFSDGSRKILGIILTGEHKFNTEDKELMEIYSGHLIVLLPYCQWQTIRSGESFEVAANSTFE